MRSGVKPRPESVKRKTMWFWKSLAPISRVRPRAVLGVAAVVWGWGVAQYPALLPGTGLTLTSGAAPHSVLVTVVVIFVAAAVLVGPSFLLLFWLHGRQLLEGENHNVDGAADNLRT